jgi:predicted nucleic-acid-binding protein
MVGISEIEIDFKRFSFPIENQDIAANSSKKMIMRKGIFPDLILCKNGQKKQKTKGKIFASGSRVGY